MLALVEALGGAPDAYQLREEHGDGGLGRLAIVLLREIARVLRPGVLLIATVTSRSSRCDAPSTWRLCSTAVSAPRRARSAPSRSSTSIGS